MSYEQYTVEQLVEATADLNDRADTLFIQLAHIESTARSEDVAVTVNLEGRLIGLELSQAATSLPPETLAADIFRLTQEASATALTEGLTALTPIAGEALTTELSELINARPRPATPPSHAGAETPQPSAPPTEAPTPPRRPRTLDDSEDFSEVESWAVPR